MTTPPNDRGLYVAASEAARIADFDSPREFLEAIAHDAFAPRELRGDPLSGGLFNRAEVISWKAKRVNGND